MWVIERVSIIKKYSVIGKSDLQLWSTVDRNRIIQVRNATIERKEKKKKVKKLRKKEVKKRSRGRGTLCRIDWKEIETQDWPRSYRLLSTHRKQTTFPDSGSSVFRGRGELGRISCGRGDTQSCPYKSFVFSLDSSERGAWFGSWRKYGRTGAGNVSFFRNRKSGSERWLRCCFVADGWWPVYVHDDTFVIRDNKRNRVCSI